MCTQIVYFCLLINELTCLITQLIIQLLSFDFKNMETSSQQLEK